MVDFDANHHRNRVRPWFSILAMPPVFIFRKMLLNASPLEAIWLTNAACAALWSFLLFLGFRAVGVGRFAGIACCVLAVGSAGSLFWFTVPETYALSAIGLALGVLIAGIATYRNVPAAGVVLAGAFAFGTLVTNWMANLAYLAVFERWRRAAVMACASLLVAFAGWAVQKVVFPMPAALFGKGIEKEGAYTLHEEQGGPLRALHSAILTSGVAPTIAIGDSSKETTGGRLTVQRSSALAGPPLALAATAGWLGLLVAGFIALVKGGVDRRFRVFLALLACGQLGLHSIYGEETFLYSLHFATVLVCIAALACARWRRPGVAGAVLAVALLVAASNVIRLREAAASPFSGNDARLQRLIDAP
jgi:hypothetical protein